MPHGLILNYHFVSGPQPGDLYSVKEPVLLEHLRLIRELGIPVVSLEALAEHQHDLSIALTFDDGYTSDLERVIPLLEQFAYPAAFFPIINYIGKPGRLNWQHLNAICQRGFIVGSHGVSHRVLTKLPDKELERELTLSKSILEEKTGTRIQHFALPEGWYNQRVVQHAKQAGYRHLLTTGLKFQAAASDDFIYSRWNITGKVPAAQLKKVLLSKGRLPVSISLAATLKRYAKNLLGPSLSNSLHTFVNYG